MRRAARVRDAVHGPWRGSFPDRKERSRPTFGGVRIESPSRKPRRKASSTSGLGFELRSALLRRLLATPAAMRFGSIMAVAPRKGSAGPKADAPSGSRGERSGQGLRSGRYDVVASRPARAGARRSGLLFDLIAIEMARIRRPPGRRGRRPRRHRRRSPGPLLQGCRPQRGPRRRCPLPRNRSEAVRDEPRPQPR